MLIKQEHKRRRGRGKNANSSSVLSSYSSVSEDLSSRVSSFVASPGFVTNPRRIPKKYNAFYLRVEANTAKNFGDQRKPSLFSKGCMTDRISIGNWSVETSSRLVKKLRKSGTTLKKN